jgi:topoisomerase-4 subunit A
VNRSEGFIGYGKDMKKEEFVSECSDIDDIIAFTKEGNMKLVRNAEKVFVGKDILYVAVWKKNDERMTYNAVYVDGKTGVSFAKRFNATGLTRDKDYPVTQGNPRSKILYLSANPNGEVEVVNVVLQPTAKARIKVFEFNFEELEIKNRGSKGNIVTKYGVKKIDLKSKGKSTLGGVDIWLDEDVGRLNTERRGKYLGSFQHDERILVVLKSGEYMLTNYEPTNRYPMNDVIAIEKFYPNTIISAVHYSDSKKANLVKRFQVETTTIDQKYSFIADEPGAKLVFATLFSNPTIEYTLDLGKGKVSAPEKVNLTEFIEVKGWKALGNKLAGGQIKSIQLAETPVNGKQINEDIDFEITNLNEPEQGSLF